MSVKKSLFTRYLSISLLIVLISFMILGVMLVFFVAQYSESEKRDLLDENAKLVSEMISERTISVNNDVYLGESDTSWVRSVISTISSSINADIFITDINGNTKMCSESGNCPHLTNKVPKEVCDSIALNNGVFLVTTLGSIYKNNQFVTGVPIIADVGNSQVVAGMVFAATEANTFSDFTGEITRIFFLAAISTFVIVFCIIGFFTYNMVRPLRQMSLAANSFAKGDFSVRVPVTSSDEIGQLSQAFNNMADSLSVSEGTRRSFIANVSHELKTPMTTIAGFIDGILDGTIPQERQNYYLNIVSVEVRRLSRLVSSMLSLSRIDNGELKMNKQRFDINDIVINTLLTFEQKIAQRDIEIKGLENTESTFVDGDPDLIHQVIYNLVENAVKFTNVGGYIQINLKNLPNKVILEIKNSGQGIEPEELVHIFERFYKTDKSRSQDKNGMGLGLYIVKTIMRLHGGDITAKSKVNEYCSFEFWLPKEKEKSTLKQRKEKAEKGSREAVPAEPNTAVNSANRQEIIETTATDKTDGECVQSIDREGGKDE